jgi:hypothetical protein
MQKSCKSKKLITKNQKMIGFQRVAFNLRVARSQVLRQYSAISWPFFATFTILLGEFIAGRMHSCVLGKEASMKEKLNIVSIQKWKILVSGKARASFQPQA